jgi:nicotinamide mononucleotide (NMN) deamidase PncC
VADLVSREHIERIHASGRQVVVAVTGGGSRAIGELVSVAGASASVLEAVVPYSQAALDRWHGGPVDQACSERTARAMAMAAFERARSLSDADPRMLRGIGATASLATTRPKHGEHRIHVAWQSAEATVALSCELAKGTRSRDQEEAIAAQLVLQAVAEACGVVADASAALTSSESLTRREKLAPADWTELLLEQRSHVLVSRGELASAGVESPRSDSRNPSCPSILFPGAFNPLHAAHRRMAEISTARCGGRVTLELSIKNVDKPTLDFLEIEDRLQSLRDYPVLLTRTATFGEKTELAPRALFVVGVDTMRRIGDVRYYGDSDARRDAAIAAIAARDCRFLVFGRVVGNRFCTLSDLVELPADLSALCDEVTEDEFREDVSSTLLRRQD